MPLPGMPNGKLAGERCVHLLDDFSCAIYDERPPFCADFQAEESVCGVDRAEAIELITFLERSTL